MVHNICPLFYCFLKDGTKDLYGKCTIRKDKNTTHKLLKNSWRRTCPKGDKKNFLEMGGYVIETVCNAKMFLKLSQNYYQVCLEHRLATVCISM